MLENGAQFVGEVEAPMTQPHLHALMDLRRMTSSAMSAAMASAKVPGSGTTNG